MNAPLTPDDLDQAVLAMKRSNAAMPVLCRRLCADDLWVLLPYHPELAEQDFELKNGMPFPFGLLRLCAFALHFDCLNYYESQAFP